MEVTKNIFQIFISNGDNPSNISDELIRKTNQVKSVYSDYNYTLYNHSMLLDFLSDFDKETLNSYNTIKPYAFKADLSRYCLLYEYGGWYFDISLAPEFKLEFDDSVDAMLIKNYQINGIENCVMYFKPKSQFLMDCVKQVNFHVLRRYYGHLPLEVSGPGLLRRIYNRYSIDYFKNYKFGSFDDLSVLQFVCKYEGKIFARFKFPETRGLDHLGARGTNNYETMWNNNDVYHS
jgi:mannosyltransferase OCH1-like enzyme